MTKYYDTVVQTMYYAAIYRENIEFNPICIYTSESTHVTTLRYKADIDLRQMEV